MLGTQIAVSLDDMPVSDPLLQHGAVAPQKPALGRGHLLQALQRQAVLRTAQGVVVFLYLPREHRLVIVHGDG